MRSSLVIGFLATIGTFVWALEGDWTFYFQKHSIVIVIGGTVSILFFSNSLHAIKRVFVSIFHLGKAPKELDAYEDDLMTLVKTRNVNNREETHPLIKYAIDLWEQGVDSKLFIVLLSQKRNELISSELEVVSTLKNLAKYPPALGMAGTVMGMVELFLNLESNKGSVGSSLAFAMTATFFGIVLTNVFISPLADRLHVKTVNDRRKVTSLYEIILLINGNNPSSLVMDEVKQRAA